MIEKKQNGKNIVPEIVAFAIFVMAAFVMSFFHDLNHEEAQAFLLAKDSTIARLLFDLPHYQDVSPLYMLFLAIAAKAGIPAVVALKIVSIPFSFAAAFLIIFKAPFKKWIRMLIPFMFFLFYEYTVISSPYAILFAAFIFLALFYGKRNEKPVLYILALTILGFCGIYGLTFAIPLALIRLYELVRREQEHTEEQIDVNKDGEETGIQVKGNKEKTEEQGKTEEQDKLEKQGKRGYIPVKKEKGSIYAMIALIVVLLLAILPLLPNVDSYSELFTDHSHPVRNLIYTLFILPGDSVITDVDFYGLLQNQSWRFVGLKPISVSSYFASAAILACLYYVTYKYKKRRYFIISFLTFSTTAALGMLYHYQIGAIIPFEIFLLWICLEEKDGQRQMPNWLIKLELSGKKLVEKITGLVLVFCIGVSLIWSCLSCINDIKNEVWYARQLNAVLEENHLTGYRIVSDWNYLRFKDGFLYLDYSSKTDGEIESAEDLQEGNLAGDMETAEKTQDDNYVITYFVKQMDPEEYYQMPNDLNFVDALAYSKNGNNYFANLNDGAQGKRYKEYAYEEFEQSKAEAIKLGEEGYPDIIIGDPNIVGLMGLSAEDVRYYLIYEIRIRTSYKMYSVYQSWQMFIRDDLYMSRDRWPFMDQNY